MVPSQITKVVQLCHGQSSVTTQTHVPWEGAGRTGTQLVTPSFARCRRESFAGGPTSLAGGYELELLTGSQPLSSSTLTGSRSPAQSRSESAWVRLVTARVFRNRRVTRMR